MIDRSQPQLSVSAQCAVLQIGRAPLYYRPKSESAEALAPMRRIDKLFMQYPFYRSRQIVRHLAREGAREAVAKLRLNFVATGPDGR